jgi:hypothetical protein
MFCVAAALVVCGAFCVDSLLLQLVSASSSTAALVIVFDEWWRVVNDGHINLMAPLLPVLLMDVAFVYEWSAMICGGIDLQCMP